MFCTNQSSLRLTHNAKLTKMPESVFSTYWYRVAKLKPLLRDAAIISRHVYRGQAWYVLRNSLSGRSHRFNAAAYALIGRMNGQRSVQEIWEHSGKLSIDATPTQDEVIRLLGRLHDADLIQSDILERVGRVEGVRSVKVSDEWVNKWNPEDISDRARENAREAGYLL